MGTGGRSSVGILANPLYADFTLNALPIDDDRCRRNIKLDPISWPWSVGTDDERCRWTESWCSECHVQTEEFFSKFKAQILWILLNSKPMLHFVYFVVYRDSHYALQFVVRQWNEDRGSAHCAPETLTVPYTLCWNPLSMGYGLGACDQVDYPRNVWCNGGRLSSIF